MKSHLVLDILLLDSQWKLCRLMWLGALRSIYVISVKERSREMKERNQRGEMEGRGTSNVYVLYSLQDWVVLLSCHSFQPLQHTMREGEGHCTEGRDNHLHLSPP